MSKARDSIEDLKTIDANLAAKSPLASPVFTGNVGVGVTPANNATPASGVQVGATASIGAWESGSNIITTVASNSYYNSAYKYITTNTAALIRLINGAINFNVAPSGSANTAISWTTAMNINAAGIVTKPLQPAFDAHHNGGQYSSGTSISSTNLNAVRLNTGNHYSTSGLRFVAPVAGVYRFNYKTIVNGAVTNAHVRMFKNGSIISGSDSHYSATWSNTYWSSWAYSILVSLSANDYVQVGHTSNAVIHGNDYQSFNGYLIG